MATPFDQTQGLSLAPGLGAFFQGGGVTGESLQKVLARLSGLGFEAVQLDATLAGIRHRDLSAEGRKDLVARVRRQSMAIAGIDLFIPRRHFVESRHADRAMSAVLATIDLAGDLGRVAVSVGLPVGAMTAEQLSAIVKASDDKGVPAAVHCEEQMDKLVEWLDGVGLPGVGAGIDPAAALGCGVQPEEVVHRLGRRLLAARLNDQKGGGGSGVVVGGGFAGGTRCIPGRGDLRLQAYRVALELAARVKRTVVLDLVGVGEPYQAAEMGKQAWESAVGFGG